MNATASIVPQRLDSHIDTMPMTGNHQPDGQTGKKN
jgi:hypothetical protein